MDFAKQFSNMFPGSKVNIAINPNSFNKTTNQQDHPNQHNHYNSSGSKGGQVDSDIFYSLLKGGNFFSNQEGQFSYLGLTPPTYDYPQYKQKFLIEDKEINKKINETIQQLKQIYSCGAPIFNSKLLRNLLVEDTKMKKKIQKLFQKGYSKAGVIWVIGFIHGMVDDEKVKTIEENLQKQVNPLFYAIAALKFMQKNQSKAKELLEKAIKYKEPFAFQFMGEIYQKQDKYLKAFQMFKVAEKMGFWYSAKLHIADLYIQGSEQFPCNTFRAIEYETKVAEIIFYPKQKIPTQKVYFSYPMKNLQKRQQQKNLLEAHLICAYLQKDLSKIKQYSKKQEQCFHRPIVQQFRQNLRATSGQRQKTTRNFQIIKEIDMKTGIFVGKCLVKESMQIIVIDQWEQIKNKNQIHQTIVQGKKLRVHFFVQPQFNGLIVHVNAKYFEVVKDPYIAKYQITNQILRNYGKLLLINNYQLESIVIYDYLLQKGKQQLAILESNKGLAYDRKGKYQEAEKCFKQSLQFYYYQKSLLRLAYLYIKTNRNNKALQTSKLVKDQKQRLILENKIKESQPKSK